MSIFTCCMSAEDRFKVTHTAWFDVSIGNVKNNEGEKVGQIQIHLFGNLVPRTVRNFIKLTESREAGTGYLGTPFHRIEKECLIQGGDFTLRNGRGGRSIYGETFKDENFVLKHSRPGIVSMANLGRKNTNGSQFFIILKPMHVFDNEHVAFGEVTEESMNVVRTIENVEVYGNCPTVEVIITDCGVDPGSL